MAPDPRPWLDAPPAQAWPHLERYADARLADVASPPRTIAAWMDDLAPRDKPCHDANGVHREADQWTWLARNLHAMGNYVLEREGLGDAAWAARAVLWAWAHHALATAPPTAVTHRMSSACFGYDRNLAKAGRWSCRGIVLTAHAHRLGAQWLDARPGFSPLRLGMEGLLAHHALLGSSRSARAVACMAWAGEQAQRIQAQGVLPGRAVAGHGDPRFAWWAWRRAFKDACRHAEDLPPPQRPGVYGHPGFWALGLAAQRSNDACKLAFLEEAVFAGNLWPRESVWAQSATTCPWSPAAAQALLEARLAPSPSQDPRTRPRI